MTATILLVVDNNERRESVRMILKANGYRVVESADCELALSLLARQRFDLVLLDVTLPDQNGVRLLEFIKRNHLATKAIVITGTVGLENSIMPEIPVERKYVTTPYNPHYLLNSIEHALSEHSQSNLKLQIIEAGDFIHSTPAGDLDMKASKAGLARIAATGTDLQDYTVLIDLRDVTSRLSTPDIYELGSELVTLGNTFRRKTAVLFGADGDGDQTTFFENVSLNQGVTVRAFSVFEDALTWLSSMPVPAGVQTPGGRASQR